MMDRTGPLANQLGKWWACGESNPIRRLGIFLSNLADPCAKATEPRFPQKECQQRLRHLQVLGRKLQLGLPSKAVYPALGFRH